jgi:hypothetical protein
MTDPAGHYTDPLEEALSQGAQRIAQLASLLGAAAEVTVRRKTLKDARAAAGASTQASQVISGQEHDAYQQARLRWAPAHDPRWLAQADLLQTARAWSAAACYADTDPLAASAMRKCEQRLRALHPYAMARYDRLRSDAINPLDAMNQTAPLFGRAPHARPGEAAATRAALDTAPAQGDPSLTDEPPDIPPEPAPDADQDGQAERRGRQIAERLQARARAAGRYELGPDELAIVLETVTNLPQDVIDRITQPVADERPALAREHHAAHAEQARAADPEQAAAVAGPPASQPPGQDLPADRGTESADRAGAVAVDRTAAQIAAENFPHTAATAVTAAVARSAQAARSPARTTAPRQARRSVRPR